MSTQPCHSHHCQPLSTELESKWASETSVCMASAAVDKETFPIWVLSLISLHYRVTSCVYMTVLQDASRCIPNQTATWLHSFVCSHLPSWMLLRPRGQTSESAVIPNSKQETCCGASFMLSDGSKTQTNRISYLSFLCQVPEEKQLVMAAAEKCAHHAQCYITEVWICDLS